MKDLSHKDTEVTCPALLAVTSTGRTALGSLLEDPCLGHYSVTHLPQTPRPYPCAIDRYTPCSDPSRREQVSSHVGSGSRTLNHAPRTTVLADLGGPGLSHWIDSSRQPTHMCCCRKGQRLSAQTLEPDD